MHRKFFIFLFAAIALTLIAGTRAQSPAPVVVATEAAKASAAVPGVSPSLGSETAQATIKLLQEMKAANEQTLKKQQAALDALDELLKEADQIRIFSRRS